ncbi:GNAT family N-acetyltransferase [Cellvibrio sp. NN19]|uniref:GNAT family N-acetyltransferase n=1 Tax=Cellvibrio chitinivorans TaxID=3102792 RepID=UPI002B414764|nr:GNAT family N-acetyltransferase [Cellvibrio sp. NN19]
MNTEKLKQLNVDNLTSLWRRMGINKNSEWNKKGLTVSEKWPNRYWFDWDANIQQINSIVPVLHQLPAQAVVPVWIGAGQAANQLEVFLKDECFQVLFSQQAMYLDLQQQVLPNLPELNVIEAQSPTDIETWVATASAAFGYTIDVAAIAALVDVPEVKLLLLKEAEQAVATALVYQTGDVIGVHLVGVPDEYRGRGFARMIMQQVIKISIEMGGKYLTLQASAAGEPLYLQLGFERQFEIRNYKRSS